MEPQLEKRKVLIVPAWLPCDFFETSQLLVGDVCDVRFLCGKLVHKGKRKALNDFLFRRHTSFAVNREGNVLSVRYEYVNNLPSYMFQNQINILTTQLGEQVLLLFDGEKPDVIHIQSLSDTAYFICRWAHQNDIHIVLTEHILFVRHEWSALARLRERVYEQVDEVLCVSNYLYRNLLTSGFNMKKISIIGNYVDTRFIASTNNILKNGKILFIANHYHDKGMDTLLKVAQKLKKEGVRTSIDVIGLGELDVIDNKGTLLLNAIRYYQVDDIINIKGKMSHEALLQQYASYNLLLSTSVSETFGLAVAEAITYGIKVLCTDSGGIRDFVNESNGKIVNIGDVDAIVQAVMEYLICSNLDSNIREESVRMSHMYGEATYRRLLEHLYGV